MKVAVAFMIMMVGFIQYMPCAQTFKGIKMCQRDCDQTKGCTGIHYDPAHLECRILFGKIADPVPPAGTRRVVKASTVRHDLNKCALNDLLIVSKRGKIVCVPSEANNIQTEHSQLLLTGSKSYQLDLETHAVREFYFPWNDIECLTYMKSADKFVFNLKDALITTPTTNMTKTVLTDGIIIHQIAVDEEENIIFLKKKPQRDEYRLCTLNMNGTQFKCLAAASKYLKLFDVDTKHKLLYVLRMQKVISFTYEGTPTQDLVQNMRGATIMVYDSMQSVFYYSQGAQLKMVTRTGRPRQIAVFKRSGKRPYPYSMRINGNNIYISATKMHGEIYVKDVTTSRRLQVIKVPADTRYYELCLF